MGEDWTRSFQTNSAFFSEGRWGAALRQRVTAKEVTAKETRSLRCTSPVNS
jgi:hypothetical protein